MNCTSNEPLRLLRGVTRTIALSIFGKDGETPIDLTDVDLHVEVSRDGSYDRFSPEVTLTGEDNNIVKFGWPVSEQKNCGRYTIDLIGDFGEEGVSRTNWHGPNGIELVEYSELTTDAEIQYLGVESIELNGTMDMGGGSQYYIKPAGGIPYEDLSEGVQASLDKADLAQITSSGITFPVNPKEGDIFTILAHDDVPATNYEYINGVWVLRGTVEIVYATTADILALFVPVYTENTIEGHTIVLGSGNSVMDDIIVFGDSTTINNNSIILY